MAGPWEKYATPDAPAGARPWEKYQQVAVRPKEYNQVQSAGQGLLAGEGWGFNDEAAGGREVILDQLPDWSKPAVRKIMGSGPNRVATGVANAAAGMIAEQFLPEDSGIRENYIENRDAQRLVDDTARYDNPVSYGLGEFAGAAASGPSFVGGAKAAAAGAKAGETAVKTGLRAKAAGAAKQTGKYTLEGGAYGATYGFGNADGDIADRLGDAALGGAIGAAGGFVLGPAAEYAVAPIVKAIGYKAFTSAENKALDMVLRRAERSGTSLEKVRADFEAWNKTGEVPETLAEFMGPNERGLLSAMVTANRQSEEAAKAVLLERGKNEVNLLEGRFAEAMGADRKDFPKAKAEAARARASDPEPYYDFAHFHEREGRKYQTFFNNETAGRFLSEIEQSEVAREAVKSAAKYADTMRLPKIRDELKTMVAQIENGQRPRRVSVQAADYVERMINRKYDQAVEGKGKPEDVPSGLKNLRDGLRAIIDPSGIGEARAIAAERIRRGELLKEGRKFMNKNVDVEDIDQVLQGYKTPEIEIPPASPEGRQAYTIGAARAIGDDLRNQSNMKGFADATRKVARTPAIREKINAVLPKKLTKKGKEDLRAKQTRLNAQLEQEVERVANRSDFTVETLGNSRTAFRQADMADASIDDTFMSNIGEAIGSAVSQGPAAAQSRMLQKLGNWAENKFVQPGVMNPEINRSATEILLSQGDDMLRQLARLQQRANTGPVGKTLRGPGGGAAPAAGGSGGGPPAPQAPEPAPKAKSRKRPKKKLGRGLDDLINEPGPVKPAGFLPDGNTTGPGKLIAKGLRAADRRVRSPRNPRRQSELLAPSAMDTPTPGKAAIESMRVPDAAAAEVGRAASDAEQVLTSGRVGRGSKRAAQAQENAKAVDQYLTSYDLAAEKLRDAERAAGLAKKSRSRAYRETMAARAELESAMDELRGFFGADGGHTKFKTQKAKAAAQAALLKRIDDATAAVEAAKAKSKGQTANLRQIADEVPAAVDTSVAALVREARRFADTVRQRLREEPGILPDLRATAVPGRRQLETDNEMLDLLLNPDRAEDAYRIASGEVKPLGSHELKGQAVAAAMLAAGVAGSVKTSQSIREQKAKSEVARFEEFRDYSENLASDGDDMVEVQGLLNVILGTNLVLDGKFGTVGRSKTSEAVRKYQKKRGLVENGKLNAQTIRALQADEDRLSNVSAAVD